MKILKIISQHRRDFTAEYECENCGNKVVKGRGYDDNNFHQNVIPKMMCEECGKSRNDLGIKGEVLTPRYPDEYQI